MPAENEADRIATDVESQPSEQPAPTVVLRSLAPEYEEPHHAGYLRHLEDAMKDPRNRNIALTGRYGSGKSSVLDQFERAHKADTLRISINTLGPDEDDEDLTNRIQKELVKQLVYRAEPGKLRRSRFVRSRPLTRWRAFFEAVGITAGGLLLLWLIGLRPGDSWFGGTSNPFLTLLLGGIFVALVVAVVWVVRLVIGDRVVSQVTTAGTTITLGDKPTTYFDGYLDEIVAFFDAVEPKYVIFEDLDRFDDPQIFDSLRELNTLINASSHWIGKDHPLRYIYAIKDSLFEKIGTDLDEKDPGSDDEPSKPTTDRERKIDLAAAAVERANRTKFFELVVPVVPFISHRNARDLLAGALTKLGLPKDLVTRPLLDLVARHTTDMRLLINICNEFAVFAEQLYWTENRAPGMTPDDLFALVAYKNFHLADFEAIPQRASALDALENSHRGLVRATIEELQKKRRELIRTEEKRRVQDETAATLGARLLLVKDLVSARTSYGYAGIYVQGQTRAFDEVTSPTFWRHVSEAGTLTLTPARPNYENNAVIIDAAQLTSLFPDSMDSDVWRDSSPAELTRQVRRYDEDIASLRGADFKDLAHYENIASGKTPFKDTITSTLDSELARDLVRRGFLTRNYAEYSARFYGSFIGVDVAFFYNHSVQPNQMYVDYSFKTENAVANLLEQVPADFTSSASALNLEVVSYLLGNDLAAAKEVVEFVVADFSKDAQTFLDAFINSPTTPREKLVALLAEHPWRDLFQYIATHSGMPDEDTRIRLLDAALLSSKTADAYDVDGEALSLLSSEYANLGGVRDPQSPERTATIYGFLQSANILVEDLGVLGAPLRTRVVAGEMYQISTPNLQLALEITTTPTIDEARKHEAVWHYVKENIDVYLGTLFASQPDAETVTAEAVLQAVISEQHGTWSDEQLARVIASSSQTAALADITDVPLDAWPLLVAERRVMPAVANVNEYASAHGIDHDLVQFLVDDGEAIPLQGVDEVDEDDRRALAVLVLNAGALLPASVRVGLAIQLDLRNGVDAAALAPAGDDLLARALEAGLVPDEASTFEHFSSGGWASVAAAFAVSENVETFLTPALVSGYVAELVRSAGVPEVLRNRVAEEVTAFVPDDEVEPLRAVGVYAAEKWIRIPREQVSRIARVTMDASAVLPHLVRDRDLSPDQLIETMAFLGAPYNALTSGPGVEFDLPPVSSAKTLLERLEGAGRVEIFSRGWGAGKGVRNRM
ncbi:hypothetical protein [Microbacterium sp. bgisy189]|uniref:YobI family P-loop NTPase n=1 Tax=Microbacterium sp. bgisy189 TaxID=3413798 RepID=UPI003EBDCEA0